MNKKIIRLVFFFLALIAIFLVFLMVKNQIIDIIKYAKENDKEAIKELIIERGILGVINVILIEAIQMVVIFIPAEFIQLAIGLSYPLPFAFLFCLCGVFIGASIIYFLVNVLNLNRSVFYRSSKKLDDLVNAKKQNVTIKTLMYLLFIMPVIPFGAICYFGASSKMKFRSYIFTVVTGVIPSICFSLAVARVVLFSVTEAISLYLIVGIIIILAIILFSVLILIIKKKFFISKNDLAPNGIYYNVLYFIFNLFRINKFKYKVDRSGLENVTGPALILFNHASIWDFIVAAKILAPHRITVVTNRYYFRHKILKKLLRELKAIPKSLFYPDVQTIKHIMLASKKSRYIVMFPEGRLSTDGTQFNIVEGAGTLIKKLKIQVIICNISGTYLIRPKWSKVNRYGLVKTKVNKMLSVDEVEQLSVEEIEKIINEELKYNEFDFAYQNNLKYRSKKFSEGLEGVLYYCPKCHKEFSIKTKNNLVFCSHCQFEVTLNSNYTFSNNQFGFNNIHDWNQHIIQYELNNLVDPNYSLKAEVKVRKLHPENEELDEWGYGTTTLNRYYFTFDGKINDSIVSFSIQTKTLKALAFSVNEEFECYYESILYFFYPIDYKEQCAKWALVQDLIYQKAVNEND